MEKTKEHMAKALKRYEALLLRKLAKMQNAMAFSGKYGKNGQYCPDIMTYCAWKGVTIMDIQKHARFYHELLEGKY